MRHTISVLVENEFGVLARVAGLFSGRGFNIESLSVAETLDPTISRLTLVTRGDDQVLEQIEKQLNIDADRTKRIVALIADMIAEAGRQTAEAMTAEVVNGDTALIGAN